MRRSPDPYFITVLFGPMGDALMALALFDDILTIAPGATLLILTRRNASMLRTLASEYPQIEVREIPNGFRALPFFTKILMQRGWILLTLGLVSIGYSLPLRLFFLAVALIPGNRTIGFHDRILDITLSFDISLLMIDNLRRLLPYAFTEWKGHIERPPHLRIRMEVPKELSLAGGGYIVAHLFGVSIPHTLPPHRWQTLFSRIRKEYPRYNIVLTGSPSQKKYAEEVAGGLDGVMVRTDLSLHELAYIIDNAALYIGIDTGVTHLAGLLQQKSIVIRHCSDPTWIPTYNPHARVLVNSRRCAPSDPMLCGVVTEDGREYRRSTYDISDELIFDSVVLALSQPQRAVPKFAGLIDEKTVS